MTQAEKAKVYDKALEKARKELQTCGSQDCDAARQVFRLFPELKESEDERIKREILDLVSIAGNGNQFEEIKDWLDKKIVVNNITMDEYNENVKALMPELAESEDERIRKELLEHCKNQAKLYIYTGNKCPQIQSWISWLEKHGEKLPVGFYYVNSEGKKFYSNTFKYGDVTLHVEKQGDNLVENGYTNNKDIIKYADNYSHEIWHKLMDNFKNIKDYHIGCNDVSDIVLNAIIDAYNWIEKQGEQKSQKVLTWKHWENGIAGNSEGEDTFLIKWSPWHYSVSSCLGSECDYIELSELDELLRKPNFETKEVTGTLKEMDPVELEETRKEMMESMPTDEEVQKLHDHLEMHKQLPKSEPQTITFIDSGTERIVDKLLMLEISVDAINQLQIKEHQRLFEALNEIIGKLGDLYEVLSKPYVFPYRDYTPPSPVPGMDVWYKTHGVEKVPPVTCETTTVCKPETISFDADLQKGSDYDIDNQFFIC